MSNDKQELRLGQHIQQLPKSMLPAGAAIEGGHYPFFCSSAEKKATDQWLEEGDAVLMGTGGVATVHLGTGRFAYSTDTWGFRSRSEEIDTHFLYRVIRHALPKIDYSGFEGSGLRHLRKDFVRDFVYEFPRLNQQRRIAEILSTLDEAIEQTEALIAKHQQIKAGLMHDLFTRGVTPDGHLRPTREQAPDLYKESPFGWIPKEWKCELLDDLAVRGSGHTPNKNFPGYWNGGIKWISLADSSRLDRLYIADTEYEISQLGIQNSSAVVHPAGTVVLSRDAGVGKSAITTQPMAVSQHFMCWRCDSRLNKHFLYYWLQFKKRMFENIAMGSTILTIGLPYFKKLKIAAPKDAEEQQMIGDSLLSADEQIFSLEADLEKIKQQKHGLMHDLLTGCVRVPLAKTKEVSTMAHAPSDLEPNT